MPLLGATAESAYGYHTAAQITLDDLRDSLEFADQDASDQMTERRVVELARDFEQFAQEGLQKFPLNEHLLALESQYRLIVDQYGRAEAALRKAFGANPRQDWIAIRLSATGLDSHTLSADACRGRQIRGCEKCFGSLFRGKPNESPWPFRISITIHEGTDTDYKRIRIRSSSTLICGLKPTQIESIRLSPGRIVASRTEASGAPTSWGNCKGSRNRLAPRFIGKIMARTSDAPPIRCHPAIIANKKGEPQCNPP